MLVLRELNRPEYIEPQRGLPAASHGLYFAAIPLSKRQREGTSYKSKQVPPEANPGRENFRSGTQKSTDAVAIVFNAEVTERKRMFGDKKVQYLDSVFIAGMHGVEVTVRGVTHHYSFEEFAKVVYPLFDAQAKTEETKTI